MAGKMEPYSNAYIGIQLAQQGQTLEALAYLRRAVRNENPDPEVWLWLAHVSPDINEYRNCIYQALKIEPHHPVALQMQQALNDMDRTPTPYAQSYGTTHISSPQISPAATRSHSPSNYAASVYTPPPAPKKSSPPAQRYSNDFNRKACMWVIILAVVGMMLGAGIALAIAFM